MNRFALDAAAPAEIADGLRAIAADRADRFAPGGVRLRFVRDERAGGPRAEVAADGVTVRYARPCHAFRALGRLLGQEGAPTAFAETARFDLLGAMIDVSRNGVLRLDAAKAFLRRTALMGLNMAILYAEDTYEVPGEPFFGYLRGGYTQAEMRELDDYAHALGIEMFPCIQTLGHLEQILQWPAYGGLQDVSGVLMADEPRTYALIERMLDAASAPFRSKRIHIGMDEAHGVGTGNYRKKHGEKRPFDVLNGHLHRVAELCAKRGLQPMIWSDMYFRLGAPSHDYYDPATVIPPDVASGIPRGVELVYWDYYHHDQAFYEDWIERHRALGSEPLMAGGVWTWTYFWANLPQSRSTTEACMRACKAKGLRQAFVTMWGDDGMECDVMSALPGVQVFAEHGYHDAVDERLLRANFAGSCDATFDAWWRASDLDSPGVAERSTSVANPSKWLLWQDPLLSVMDPFVAASPRAHYRELADDLERRASARAGDARLLHAARVARAVAAKCDLRRDLAAAYAAGDRARLRRLLDEDVAAARRAVDALWRSHRELWLATYRPFGLEVIEQRYGFIRTRLESLALRLDDYLAGRVDAIPELAAELRPLWQGAAGTLPNVTYARVASPSWIK